MSSNAVADVTRPRILVTGATGRIGRLVVDELTRASAPVRALTRRPGEASLPAGVEVVGGDFTNPASLEPALADVTAMFLVWTAPLATAPDLIARIASHPGHRARVVLLSSPHQTPHPFFQQPNPMRTVHVELERLLAASGLDVAVVRPGMFASNVLHWWAPQLQRGDVVRWPYAAVETAPIDERDLAAVVARILQDDRHARADLVLTGPDSLSHADQLRIIGDATGRRLRLDPLTPDGFRRDTSGRWPPAVVEMLLSAWRAAEGHPAFLSPGVEAVLGAPPRTFQQWAAEHASAFCPAAPIA